MRTIQILFHNNVTPEDGILSHFQWKNKQSIVIDIDNYVIVSGKDMITVFINGVQRKFTNVFGTAPYHFREG